MKKRKLNIKKLIKFILITIFMITCIIFFITSMIKIIKWRLENNKTKEIETIIKENITINEDIAMDEFNLDNYDINFSELKKINSEVVGYIKVENTNVESTIVKHKDNDFYLNHTFDKSYNTAGWIFAHYKNKYDGTDRNYVIFGHSRKDNSMFGSLKNILTEEWQNKNSKIIFITENSKKYYEVISVYKIKAEDYYIRTEFSSDNDFDTFIKTITNRSLKDFKQTVSVNDKLLTLSTCDNTGKYRIVLHAKEIKES